MYDFHVIFKVESKSKDRSLQRHVQSLLHIASELLALGDCTTYAWGNGKRYGSSYWKHLRHMKLRLNRRNSVQLN